jgi:putative flippase GtrA
MKQVAREVFFYGLAMAVALSVDIACLALLVEVAGVGYLWAAFVGFLAGGLTAYGLCVRFIFSHRSVEDRRVEALTFVSLGAVGMAVNLGVLASAVELAAVHYLHAKILAASLSFLVNYGLRKYLLFSPRQPHESDVV